ncbi:MAG: Asp-tRNA(Asn)/Glu-tRNA(Gln) amidotransferase subunit GatC [Planctomycetota bacterium]
MASPQVDIEKLARLARLNLTEDEKAAFAPQIADILGFVEQLGELDTTDVEPMTTALDVNNRFRTDEPQPSLSPDVATAMAAEHDEGHFLVPPVLGKKS